jgi:glycosyltransferase involved in cell wall biosynthesis
MKVLFITLEGPSMFSGGGIVVKQSLISLSRHYKVDYIGPEILDEKLSSLVDRSITLKHSNNLLQRTLYLFKGITTGFYNSWKKQVEKIRLDEYEVVYLEFSRYDFIAKYIKARSKKLIVRVHNVEQDYYNNLRISRKGFQPFLRQKYICYQEPSCLSHADYIICLTKKDKDRLIELYPNISKNKIGIVPVCVDTPVKNDTNLSINVPYILITGSLWYGPNSEGILWFIENVWKELQQSSMVIKQGYRLVLAGSSPSEEIKSIVKTYHNIDLIDSPKDIGPYFQNASIYVAPIFNGAGMKVKVAEAMSYGLPIVGTSHAFIGYFIDNGRTGYCANSAKEFKRSLEVCGNLSAEKKLKIKNNVFNHFLENYSTTSSQKKFNNIVEELRNQGY